MTQIVEIGTISSRGQVAIPSKIREKLHLKEGEKVLFFVEGDTILVKKIVPQTFAEITRPLRETAKKMGLKEKDVPGIVHRFRKSKI